ncbi:MAG: ribbon-helix-helix domain-containing protein [Bryobacterales bacterium]|nr:ribbon-helix-helix domain-containing protein [Bryobacterales bacterium]
MTQPTVHRRTPRPKSNRSGVPITVYLDESLNNRLNATSKERHVGKSSIIRLAVERLLTQLDSGQLELPLGI